MPGRNSLVNKSIYILNKMKSIPEIVEDKIKLKADELKLLFWSSSTEYMGN